MAEIRPFRGLRFSSDAGPLDTLIAPPYDVLSSEQREEHANRNPFNIVHLTLPEAKEDDRSKYVKYARSAAGLAEWRRNGILVPESRPAIYRYTQRFSLPHYGEVFTRTAILVLIKTEPYEAGVVLPHEQTFPKHKEDRLRILEATRAHLESIFGLYEDPDGAVLQAVKSAPVGRKTEATTEGIEHVLEPITDSAAISAISEGLRDKKVWIADGHHRYETARAFREAVGEREGPVAEDYMMIALSSMSDPGLVLLPTHRVVRNVPLSRVQAVARLAEAFEVEETHSSRLWESLQRAHANGERRLAAAFEGGMGYLLTPKPGLTIEGEGSQDLKSLDVTLLHRVVLESILGVKGTDGIAYTRDANEAVRMADLGQGTAFLMNPPSVDDMKRIALGGEKMPQKSTFYYPKLASGLVLWSLNDFE